MPSREASRQSKNCSTGTLPNGGKDVGVFHESMNLKITNRVANSANSDQFFLYVSIVRLVLLLTLCILEYSSSMLDEPTCHFRGAGSISSLSILFRWKTCGTPHYMASDLGLQCLAMTLLLVSRLEWLCSPYYVCVYSNSRNDVPRVTQRYGTIATHTWRRASALNHIHPTTIITPNLY